MKIGILTLPLHTNYGGILQAYALQTVLERMGHKVNVIGAPVVMQHLPLWRKILSVLKRLCQRYVLGRKDILIDREKEDYKRAIATRVYTMQFVDKYIHIRKVYKLQEIQQNDYDAIIVGSDQIWRTEYNQQWKEQNVDDVYLGFTKGWSLIRVAYAASFGKDKVELKNKDLKLCKEAISKFDAISVREEHGVILCRDIFGVKATVMPDPTLLLSCDDYKKLIPDISNASKPNFLLSYILDDSLEKSSLRDKIANEKGLMIKITNKSDYRYNNGEYPPQPPVEAWLKAFAECKYVITDSFHACVFSIIFHKQFTVIANKKRGLSRFQTLLKMFGLTDRMVYSPSEYRELQDIDFAKVDDIIKIKQEEALLFLRENLK